MRCVLFSEQHLQKDFGGCVAQSCMTCGNILRLSYSGPWPREIGIAVLSCPAYQVRMVGNTVRCSINAPFLDALASLELVISVGGQFFREILSTGQKVK